MKKFGNFPGVEMKIPFFGPISTLAESKQFSIEGILLRVYRNYREENPKF